MEDEKFDAAVVCLEGRALVWFQWLETRTPVKNWGDFKMAYVDRFRHSQLGNIYE